MNLSTTINEFFAKGYSVKTEVGLGTLADDYNGGLEHLFKGIEGVTIDMSAIMSYQGIHGRILKDNRVFLDVYKHHRHDTRRIWHLSVIRFKETPNSVPEPIALVQSAGREGQDYFKLWVFCPNAYIAFFKYIVNLIDVKIVSDNRSGINVVGRDMSLVPDYIPKGIEDFYGYNLQGHFDFY